jgi:chromosomal replication initiator protein
MFSMAATTGLEADVWERLLSSVQRRVSNQIYEIWFKPTSLQCYDPVGRRLIVRVPNKHFQYWLTKHYSDLIQECLPEADFPDVEVSFVTARSDGASSAGNADSLPDPSIYTPCEQALTVNLNPKYTFSRFVVGFCNQFAHAAALAVAEQPARAYNPLFVYGGFGLGKTHLLHAIGHYVKIQRPSCRVAYLTADSFMNELIKAMCSNRTLEFRDNYRNIDVLLVDDIQFLAG